MSFLQIPIGTYPNTFLGYESSIDITTGIDNTAFGFNTLEMLRTGSANSAFGHKALGNLTTGTNNTAIGYLSQEDTLTGALNVSVGARSLLNNISGNANVAIGEFALSQTQIANQNVAIGYESGKFMTTGSKNSILGSFTGAHPLLDIRTLSNYVVLSNGDGDPLLWITPTGTVNIPFGGLNISPSLTITGGTITANNPVLSATQTWNNAAVTFTGWQLNVTDTASNAASLLMDLQVGGVSRASVRKDGRLTLRNGHPSVGVCEFVTGDFDFTIIHSNNTVGFFSYGFQLGGFSTRNTVTSSISIGGNLTTDPQLIFGSRTTIFGEAANTLAQRNGVNAQTLRVYNTFTDASNYERGVMQWSGNILTIGAEGLGTGAVTPRVVNFIASNSSGSRRVATMRAASQVAMEVVGQSIPTPNTGVGTLTVFTLTNGLAEAALDLSYTDGSANRQGGFRFRDTQTSGDWVACQMEMVQSYGDGNRILSELASQDSAWPGLIYISRTSAGAALTTSPTHQWRNHTTTQLTIDANNNIVCNNAAIATNATNGFFYVPGCAGTPTGTPTAYTGRVPLVVDTTNNKLYFYSGGAWRDAGP